MGDLNNVNVFDEDESEEEIDLFINTEHISKAEELELEIKQAKDDLIYLASHIKDSLGENSEETEVVEEPTSDMSLESTVQSLSLLFKNCLDNLKRTKEMSETKDLRIEDAKNKMVDKETQSEVNADLQSHKHNSKKEDTAIVDKDTQSGENMGNKDPQTSEHNGMEENKTNGDKSPITEGVETLEVDLHKMRLHLEETQAKHEETNSLLTALESYSLELKCKLDTSEVKVKALEDVNKNLRNDKIIKGCCSNNEDYARQVLEVRNTAVKEKNEAWIDLSKTKGELLMTSKQLMLAIQQKVELGQQLEKWQIDMAHILEEKNNINGFH